MQVAPSMLRLLWAVIEDIQSQDLLVLSDKALIAMLVQQVSSQGLLNGQEVGDLFTYISEKVLLIRETADPYRTSS